MCTSCQAIGVGKTDLWKDDMVHPGMHPLPMPAVARWGYLWAKADRLGERVLTTLPQEQFSSEWEYVDVIPGDDAKVAGRYDWRTNLWGVGMVMWCLITRRHPPDAPIPKQVAIEPDWETPALSAAQQAANPNNRRRSRRAHTRRKVWTYGSDIYGHKRRYLDTDPELRTLVMRCLMDCPDDRPTLQELRGIIDRKLRRRWTHRNSDHHTRHGDQAQTLFRDPPAYQRIRDDELLHRVCTDQPNF